MNNYISLHTHSDGSQLDGIQTVEQIASKAAEFGMSSVALTDHGKAGNLLSFKKACEKYEVKPIYGMEAYLAPFSRLQHEKVEGYKASSHMCLLAKDSKGLQNIFKLTSIGWLEGKYYGRPRIDMTILNKYKEGIIVTGGCGSGFIPQMILSDRFDEAVIRAKQLKNMFGDDFYLEVQNHGIDWQIPLKKAIIELSKDLDIPIIVTQDSHYSNKEDHDLHKHIMKLTAGNMEFEGSESYFKSFDQLKEMFDDEDMYMFDNTYEVANKCNCNWQYGQTIWPVYDLPESKTPEQELKELTELGFEKLIKNPTDEYRERIEYELDIIGSMGFSTYFLVVQDFIKWAKENDISVGPGRGSGAGSLVCYLIGITEVDPIVYGLYFERFLNPARVSLPDLDIDFSPVGRKRVMEYVANKYGKEKCAQIGTYQFFKPRGSLKNFSRTCGLERSQGDALAALIPPDVNGISLTFEEAIKAEPKILKSEHKDVVALARKAEGLKNVAGVHAAGVLISNIDISTQLPLFTGKSGEISAQFDMHDCEEIGLVKYDFLGLKNLDVINDTIKDVKKNHDIDIDFTEISVDDQDVYKNIFQEGKLDGIFQFETSAGFRELCFKVKPQSIKDLSAITSLFRPGPLGTKDADDKSMVQHYVERKQGAEFEYAIPQLEAILKETVDVLCFQEQIMKICTDLANYTLAEADNMRRIIGKKKLEQMKLEKDKFVNGAVANGVDQTKAEELFSNIEGFAKYSFNLAHAVSYSIISYRTAWLKYYYPLEFYTSILNHSKNDEAIQYIHSAKADGITILPPDINHSGLKFTNDNGCILFGLSGIKGIGEKGAEKLLEDREMNKGFFGIEDLVKCTNKGIISRLAESGALEEITDFSREQLVGNIEAIVEYYKKLLKWEEREDRISDRLKEIELWEINREGKKPRKLPKNKEKPEFPEINKENSLTQKDKLKLENRTLGFYISGHPLDQHENILELSKYTIDSLKEDESCDGEKIALPIVVSKINEIRTRKEQNMATIIIEDKTGRQTATVFPRQWDKLKDKVAEEEVYILRGILKKVIQEDGEETKTIINITVNSLEVVEEFKKIEKDIDIKLKDGSIWLFDPESKKSPYKRQQALAYIENLKRMS